jgi:integrase
VIRVHDLRHTHATILLRDRENVKVVSERLGHASVTVTLTTYSHVMPGDQRQAAARFAALVAGAEA